MPSGSNQERGHILRFRASASVRFAVRKNAEGHDHRNGAIAQYSAALPLPKLRETRAPGANGAISSGHLNDPWDCRPFFRTSNLADSDERERVISWFAQVDRKRCTFLSESEHLRQGEKLRNDDAFLKAQIDQLTAQMYESVKKQYRIYCLSQHPDCPLMWAHYSDSCSGFCLEFSAQTGFFSEALKVEYLDAYPHLDPAETDELENARLLLRKSAGWKYEDEFRLIVTQYPYVFGNIPSTQDGFVPLAPGYTKAFGTVIAFPPPQLDRLIIQMVRAE